jgi:hypothetical protein
LSVSECLPFQYTTIFIYNHNLSCFFNSLKLSSTRNSKTPGFIRVCPVIDQFIGSIEFYWVIVLAGFLTNQDQSCHQISRFSDRLERLKIKKINLKKIQKYTRLLWAQTPLNINYFAFSFFSQKRLTCCSFLVVIVKKNWFCFRVSVKGN